jgi:hypothetical protein
MKPEFAREVMECLPTGRTLFRYAKDDYAFLLLRMLSGREPCIHKLRQTPARKLLEKPAVKPFLAACAGGRLAPEALPENRFLPGERCYRLSLDQWGGTRKYWQCDQVSRKGASLVLQMNLNREQTDKLRATYASEDFDPFKNYCHPARSGDFPTLAWARLDFDLETGEALIEEIQTDLLRDFQRIAEAAYHSKKKNTKTFEMWGGNFDAARLIHCWEKDFSEERAHWQEAMLSAAIWFLVFEIGVRRIYYHTETTGAYLKHIRGKKPPRSLYTELPRRFCFDETEEIPQLLAGEKDWSRRAKAAKEPIRFFRMAV